MGSYQKVANDALPDEQRLRLNDMQCGMVLSVQGIELGNDGPSQATAGIEGLQASPVTFHDAVEPARQVTVAPGWEDCASPA